MQSNRRSPLYHSWIRLILIMGLALGILGYAPAVAPGKTALADPPPPQEQMVESPSELDIQPPTFTPPEAQAVDREREAEIRAGLAALEIARQVGPEAVVALLDTLRGEALDLAMDEIVEAQIQLVRTAPPREPTPPISPDEEEAMLRAQLAREAANRSRALRRYDVPTEDQSLIPNLELQITSPTAPTADITVGSSPCTYTTVAAAITAANPGDRLLIEGGVTFAENLVISISLTLQGGYGGCGSGSSARTTIDGTNSGRVIDIYGDLNVSLENLDIINGNVGWGGGVRVGSNTDLRGTNLRIYNNTATTYGGGVRLWGARATFTSTNIYNNTAPLGGGVYGTVYNNSAPALNLPASADVYDNQALTGNSLGGGVYMSGGHGVAGLRL